MDKQKSAVIIISEAVKIQFSQIMYETKLSADQQLDLLCQLYLCVKPLHFKSSETKSDSPVDVTEMLHCVRQHVSLFISDASTLPSTPFTTPEKTSNMHSKPIVTSIIQDGRSSNVAISNCSTAMTRPLEVENTQEDIHKEQTGVSFVTNSCSVLNYESASSVATSTSERNTDTAEVKKYSPINQNICTSAIILKTSNTFGTPSGCATVQDNSETNFIQKNNLPVLAEKIVGVDDALNMDSCEEDVGVDAGEITRVEQSHMDIKINNKLQQKLSNMHIQINDASQNNVVLPFKHFANTEASKIPSIKSTSYPALSHIDLNEVTFNKTSLQTESSERTDMSNSDNSFPEITSSDIVPLSVAPITSLLCLPFKHFPNTEASNIPSIKSTSYPALSSIDLNEVTFNKTSLQTESSERTDMSNSDNSFSEINSSDSVAPITSLLCSQNVDSVCASDLETQNELCKEEESIETEHGSKSCKTVHLCSKCGQTYGSTSELNRHHKTHTDGKEFKCDKCGKCFSLVEYLNDHAKTHRAEKTHVCSVCNRGFVHRSTLRSHAKIHTDTKPYVCEICGKSFRRKAHLREHICLHGETKPYECDVCKKSFATATSLKCHKVSHVSEQQKVQFVCDLCGKIFKNSSNFQRHVRTHSDEAKYKCNVCGKRFKENSYLKIHSQIHSDDRPFVCEQCGKGFTHRTTLSNHLRSHTSNKPFVCDVCGKSFKRSSNLQTHSRQHSGEAPYQCNICGSSFTVAYTLRLHHRIHTGERPHKCSDCGITFARPSTLFGHKKTHLNEKAYRCKVCGKSFAEMLRLQQHLKKHK